MHTTPPAAPTLPPSGIPSRFAKLLLQYCDVRADRSNSELLALRKPVREHLRQVLSEAGYITLAPHLGFFAGHQAVGELAVVVHPMRRTSHH